MTPEERRAKYPLSPVSPMTNAEVDLLWASVNRWLKAPDYTSRDVDRTYYTIARLIATIYAERGGKP